MRTNEDFEPAFGAAPRRAAPAGAAVFLNDLDPWLTGAPVERA